MRFKLDENLPRSAAEPLRDFGHDVDSVVDEGIAGTDDRTVLKAATAGGRVVVTLDRGFGDVRRYPPGSHAGIVIVRVDDQSPRSVTEAIADLVAGVELENLLRCVSVWRDGQLRRRPPPPASGS